MKPPDFRSDINEAIKLLQLSSEDFKLVNLYKYEDILVSILKKFTTLGKEGLSFAWLWEHFKEPLFSVRLPDGWKYLQEIIEPITVPEETFWFIAEDEHRTKANGNFWLYEGKIKAIAAVIGEMYGFEYYIVQKKLNWLLCETHHEILIGVGEPIIKGMKRNKFSSVL